MRAFFGAMGAVRYTPKTPPPSEAPIRSPAGSPLEEA